MFCEKKKKRQVLLVLKAFSWETIFGCFKKHKIGKGNLYLTENRSSRNQMWCSRDNHKHMCHICTKGFLDSKLNLAVIDKISNFHEIAPKFFIFASCEPLIWGHNICQSPFFLRHSVCVEVNKKVKHTHFHSSYLHLNLNAHPKRSSHTMPCLVSSLYYETPSITCVI